MSDKLKLPRSYRPLSAAGGFRAAMTRDPDKIAMTFGSQQRSYAELVQRVDALSALLLDGLGVQPRQHGAIVSTNCIEYMEIIAGAAQAGIPLATVNPKLSVREIVDICDDAQARVVFADAERAELIRDCDFATVEHILTIGPELDAALAKAGRVIRLPVVQEWEPFSIPYTSGTTGRPKGVLLSTRSRLLIAMAQAAEYGCYSPDDRYLAFAPMAHGAGLSFALTPVFLGGHVEILDHFDPELVLRRLSEGQMTGVFMVPTHFHGIFALEEGLRSRYRPEHLKTIISNAAPLPQATKELIVDYFGDGILHETYGSTEGGVVTNLRPADQLRKERCVGLPFISTLVEIRDEEGQECAPNEVGELFSSSPYLFNGYWQRPEETAKAFSDGWVSVGDMARRDDEGYIYIVDRKKDMVITGGINVYPREIEEVLMHHPDVAEAAVVGIPDDKWGESLKAFVTLKRGAGFDPAALSDYCEGELARFKVPKQFELIDALPRNPSGKVLKTDLRQRG
jgi:acyl-CoA synthetase (AMP-forming)/AMP-acid ligase II